MLRVCLLLLGLSVLGCGGSVSKDGQSGGSAGTGGSAGGGGSGGFGGSTGGTGGGPVCCGTDADCGSAGDADDGAPAPVECVEGVCKLVPPSFKCWQDSDCPYGMCMGGSVCPCGYDCHQADQLGNCMAPTPAPAPCCTNDMACGDETYAPCVNGVCKVPVLGACWKDDECPAGQSCVGASVCPCGADCDQMDMPGKCL
ncbi:MAG: hypothetical protein IPM35_30160 [Myxococcales bacterium]|nr:hypothetical protein [Myxococcales bacterium]